MARTPVAKAAPLKAVGPEMVGSLTAVELTQLRAMGVTLNEASARFDLERRLLEAVQRDRQAYMRALLREHGMEGDGYAINEDSGAILRYPTE